jgi:hypothetical protein
VGQGEHVPLGVETGAAGPAEDLGRNTGRISFSLPNGPLTQRREDHRPGRQVDARRQRLGARRHRSSFFSNRSSTTRRYLGSSPAWWTADPPAEHLLELRPDPCGHSSVSTSLFRAAFCRGRAGRAP